MIGRNGLAIQALLIGFFMNIKQTKVAKYAVAVALALTANLAMAATTGAWPTWLQAGLKVIWVWLWA